jgi:polysaccharide biosynthesis protein PslH
VRILVITTKNPYPLYEGRALRTYNLLKQIAKKHEILLLTFVQTPEELDGIEHMRTFCSHVEAVPLHFGGGKLRIGIDMLRELFGLVPLHAVKYRSRVMRDKLRALLATQPIDVVHLEMLQLGEYLRLCSGKPVVLGEQNVESVLLRRRVENTSNPLAKIYLHYQYLKLRAYEARICQLATRVVAVSEVDANLLEELTGIAEVTPISNGVDTGYFAPSAGPRDPDRLVFVGGLTWFPNHDAIRFFCREVLPRVAEAVPSVTLTVVGKNLNDDSIREIAENPRVRLTGLVDDVRPEIAAATAYVVPLRIGGGTRLKILDALSMGTPLISTSIGCEGLDVVSGRHLLVADTADAFAREIVRVLRDPELGRRLGAAGRQLVVEKYDWSTIAPELERVYRRCVGQTD